MKFFWGVVVVLGIELRASHLLGKHGAIWAIFPVLLLVCFSESCDNLSWEASNHDLSTSAFRVAGIIDVWHHTKSLKSEFSN
jgi:hypothetical protein